MSKDILGTCANSKDTDQSAQLYNFTMIFAIRQYIGQYQIIPIMKTRLFKYIENFTSKKPKKFQIKKV